MALHVLESSRFPNSLMVVEDSRFADPQTGEVDFVKLCEEKSEDAEFTHKVESLAVHFRNPNLEQTEVTENFLNFPFKKMDYFFLPGEHPTVGGIIVDAVNNIWFTADKIREPMMVVDATFINEFRDSVCNYFTGVLDCSGYVNELADVNYPNDWNACDLTPEELKDEGPVVDFSDLDEEVPE